VFLCLCLDNTVLNTSNNIFGTVQFLCRYQSLGNRASECQPRGQQTYSCPTDHQPANQQCFRFAQTHRHVKPHLRLHPERQDTRAAPPQQCTQGGPQQYQQRDLNQDHTKDIGTPGPHGAQHGKLASLRQKTYQQSHQYCGHHQHLGHDRQHRHQVAHIAQRHVQIVTDMVRVSPTAS